MQLRPYQHEAIHNILQMHYHKGLNRQVLILPCGCGKTICFCGLIERWDTSQRIAVMVHRDELVQQTVEKMLAVCPQFSKDIGIVKARQNDVNARIAIVSQQTVHRPERWDAVLPRDLLIVDECFPAGTLVDGKPIEQYSPGDMVQSFSHDQNKIVSRKVKKCFSSQAQYLLTLSMSDNTTITLTPGHPLYVPALKQYVPAISILPGTTLLRKDNDHATTHDDVHSMSYVIPSIKSLLLYAENVQQRLPRNHQLSNHECYQSETCVYTPTPQQYYPSPWSERETCSYYETDRACSAYTRRQWARPNSYGIKDFSDIRMADQCDCLNTWGPSTRVPYALQNRRSAYSIQDCHRDRWPLTQHCGAQNARCQENRMAPGPWVVRATLHQRNRCRQFATLCPDGLVYNLEIESPHNYFAEGILVHNCHHVLAPSKRSPKGNSWYRLIEHAMDANPGMLLVGCTATPYRPDNSPIIGPDLTFRSVPYSMSIARGISDGWLVPPVPKHIKLEELRLDNVKRVAGDWNDRALDQALLACKAPSVLVDAWEQEAPGQRTLIFCPGVAMAQETAEAFNDRGINASVVLGETPTDERRDIYQKWKTGEIKVVSSCAVLCLDAETEILSKQGWQTIDTIDETHDIANWDHGDIFFAPPQAIVKRQRMKGESMVSYHSRHHNFRVTEDHRMLHLRSGNILSPVIKHARDIVGKVLRAPVAGIAPPQHVVLPTLPAKKGSPQKRLQANSFALRQAHGLSYKDSVIARKRIDKHESMRYAAPKELTINECRFIGFFLGDGTCTMLQSGGHEYRIMQSIPLIIAWLDDVIVAMNVDCLRKKHQVESREYVSYHLPRGTGFGSQQRDGLFSIEPYLEDVSLLWGCDSEQLTAIFEGFFYANGPHNALSMERAKKQHYTAMTSTDKALLDTLQALAVCHGMTGTLCNYVARKDYKVLYSLSVRPGMARTLGSAGVSIKQETQYQAERVWCVTSDTGNIITRRNGTVLVVGNTEGFDEPSVECLIMARPASSRVLFLQCLGRGLRQSPETGKTQCTLLDVVGAITRHNVLSVAHIAGLAEVVEEENDSDDDDKKAHQGDTKGNNNAISSSKQLRSAGNVRILNVEELALYRKTPLRWFQHGKRHLLQLHDSYMVLSPLDDAGELWRLTHFPRNLEPQELMSHVPLEFALGTGEDTVRDMPSAQYRTNTATWLMLPATEKQYAFARSLGIKNPRQYVTRGDISQAIAGGKFQQWIGWYVAKTHLDTILEKRNGSDLEGWHQGMIEEHRTRDPYWCWADEARILRGMCEALEN